MPDKAVALLLLGLSPFIVRAIPDSVMPRHLGPGQMLGGSAICMMLMLVTGVTGPLIDTLFLRSTMERKQIIATKAACQLFGHGLKLVYFGALIDQAGTVEPWFLAIAVASSMIGTSLGKLLLEKLSRQAVPHLVEPHHHHHRDLLRRLQPGPDGGYCLNGLFLPAIHPGREEGSRASSRVLVTPSAFVL